MIPAPRRAHTLCSNRLDGLGLCIPGSGHIGRAIGERFAGLIGKLLVLRANLPNGVMPAVVPTDARLPINHGPSAMARANRLSGLTVRFQRDIEIESIALAHFPLAQEVVPAGQRWIRGGFEFNARDVRGWNVLLASVFENDQHRSLEFDARDVRNEKTLPVSVFEDDHDRSTVVGGFSASFREGAGCSKGKYCQKTNCCDRTAHGLSPHESRERDTRFPQDSTQDNANLFQEPALK